MFDDLDDIEPETVVDGQPEVFSDGKVHVLARECQTCVFRQGNLMRLTAGRVAGMVKAAIRDDSVITCHSTLYREGQQKAACRGFVDRHGDKVFTLRLARVMDIITEIDPPTKETK